MAIDITMPALSPTMEVGTLLKWHVKVGDEVQAGQVIAEIETDKATMDVEAVDEGVVLELLVDEGTEDVAVNAVIARLEGEGGAPASEAPAKKADTTSKKEEAPKKDAAPEPKAAEPAPKPAAAPARKSGERIIASPLARRIAAEQGVDLSTITGSGPRGRIVRADVEAAAKAPAASTGVAAAQMTGEAPFEEVRLSAMRKTIARRLTESKQNVPHYYLTVDIVLNRLLKLRRKVNESLEAEGVKVSVNDFLVKALGMALERVPDANVSFDGDTMRRYSRADISVAVAIPGGLITPVVRGAASKSLSAIAGEVKELAGRAREGKLMPEEYTGGTASISNLGMYGIRQFDAVINPPEGLIIAVGAGEERPWVVKDKVKVRTVMSATGSFDHRVIDGAVGAELMKAFKELVENPLSMLV